VLLHGNDATKVGKASVETTPVRQQIEIEITDRSASQKHNQQTQTTRIRHGCQCRVSGRSHDWELDESVTPVVLTSSLTH